MYTGNLLQESLGGKSLLIILACVSLAKSNYGDTLLTLQYAVDAKQMKNKLITVEDPRTVEARPAGNQQLILDENQTLRKENKWFLAIIADTQSQLKLAPHEAQQTELELQKVKDELANNMEENYGLLCGGFGTGKRKQGPRSVHTRYGNPRS
ncbi:hypothetical protein DAPPUDRAFT_329723 [Daphnia pulex]|uniref:Kinesin motor domain-containing protein n=1 Tax=Daphnia pulex TaxID=6669 RepID=E9HHF4_DAPPU|nr:hypothetical protein DAPPUDRAFT_331091 [Daphnia pulex]EFX68855.1 hypothetical protein DAPPUDRAFT_329723 [Daphnia pulex]|eukprot:EFX67439.1 hypothetical protein DAPPUDRAFT_331091 [Daphnia pulex]